MEKNFDNLTMILDKCKEEMHGAANEDELQRLISDAHNYIDTCNSELEQAKKTIELTNEQLNAVTEAHKESEHRADLAATEESDAHTAWEMAKKMLDDATIADSLANKEAAMILQKAATVLQDTVANAEEFYLKKAQEKEEIDAATIRLLATQKSIEYTVARAYTTEGIRLRDVVLAQLMADVKTGEKEVVGWQKSIDEINKEKEVGRFNEKISALQESLRAAEEKIDLNIIAEEEEHSKQQSYLEEQKKSCRERLSAIDEQMQDKIAQKTLKDDELTTARSQYEQLLAESNSADLTLEQVARDIDDAINKDKEEKLAAFDRLDDGIEQIRQSVAVKKQDYMAAEEKVRTATSHLDDVKQQLVSLQQRAEVAKAEEESAHEAAEVARRLVDNAVKVRLSISQESADLLLSAQEALTESANAAEELEQKKYQYRIDLEQKCQEMDLSVEQAEKDTDSAEHDAVFAKAVWENEEAELVKEIERVSAQKKELDENFDHKVEEYDIRLTTVRAAADKVRSQLAAATETVADLERHLADLEQDIAAFGLERSRIESDTDERCTTYLSESQARLDVILADKQIAQNEAEVYRRELDSAQNDLAALEARAAELSAKLTAAQNSVGELIDAGSEQVLAAEIELESRKEAEEAARLAADEIAQYIEDSNVPPVDYSTIPLTNEVDLVDEPIVEEMEDELTDDIAAEEAELTDEDAFTDTDIETEELLAEQDIDESLEDLIEEIDDIIENTQDLEPIAKDDLASDIEVAEENEEQEELSIAEDNQEASEEEPLLSDEEILSEAVPEEEEISDAILEQPEDSELIIEDAVIVPKEEADVAIAETDESEEVADETVATAEETDAAAQLEIEEEIPTEEDAEAKRRAEEEAEEAAILAGLTGGLPKIDTDDSDESAEYTAWLDIISSDVIEKLMNEDDSNNAANAQTDANDWIADLEQTFIKEDLALKHNDNASSQDTDDKETAAEESSPAHNGHKDKHSAKKNKKNKKSFRFF